MFTPNTPKSHHRPHSLALFATSLLLTLAAPLAQAAYTVNADGTVTDTTTGLVWDRCVLGARTSAATSCADNTNATYTWVDALAQVTARNTAAHLGHSDWRLPNVNELESLVDLSEASGAAIDANAFPATPTSGPYAEGWHWTSTTDASDPANASYVTFRYGNANFILKSWGDIFVRLVRSGQPSASFDALAPIVNGSCGSANTTTPLVATAPSGGALCSTGTAGSVTAGNTAYTWTCAGSNGGNPSGTCSASRGYSVTPTAGANGSISPSTPQVVTYNAATAFTVTPNIGYTASASGCGGSLSGNAFTTGPVTAVCAVNAVFAAIPVSQPVPVPTPAPVPVPSPVPVSPSLPVQVPSLAVPGAVAGDGNGDGVADVNQQAVRSLQVGRLPSMEPTWVTLVAGGAQGKPGRSQSAVLDVRQVTDELKLPARMTAPLGQVWFTATTPQAGPQLAFSLYVDTSLGANGLWRQNRAGIWVNLASPAHGGLVVTEGGRLRLDFVVQDGGEFDIDGQINGMVTLPGVVGNLPQSSTAHRPQLPAGGNAF